MTYTKQTWIDNDPAYPVDADRMTHIEQGIAAAVANPMTTEGDLIYQSGGVPVRLGVGTNGQVLTSNGTDPVWGSGGGGGGSVDSVTATDTSIVVNNTDPANPTIATATLDVIATDHPPAAAVPFNSKKITGLANGTVSTDGAAFGQIPVGGTSTPNMDGTGSAGSAATWSKSDHTHPTDTSRMAATQDLSAIASANATAGNVAMNSHKITGLSNGTVSSDAAAFGQVPTSAASIGGLLAASNLSDVANAATARSNLGAAPTASPTFTGTTTAPEFSASGLTGATAASRYVGATASGAPASGTFAVGDFVIDQSGKVWICTSAGTPGTWTQSVWTKPYTTSSAPGGTPTWTAAGNVNGTISFTGINAAITNMSTNGSLSGLAGGQSLIFELTDNGTARAITWGTLFEASGNVALPTTTVISTKLTVGFIYNAATSKLRCVAVA